MTAEWNKWGFEKSNKIGKAAQTCAYHLGPR